MLYNTYHVSYHKKKNSKIGTISVDILLYFISNQINDIKLMWEEVKNRCSPSKTEVFCYSTKRKKQTAMTVQMNCDTPTTQRMETQDKYVSVLTGVLSCSIHIQFFSQNQSLLFPIENQIIIKRVARIRNMIMTQQPEQQHQRQQ